MDLLALGQGRRSSTGSSWLSSEWPPRPQFNISSPSTIHRSRPCWITISRARWERRGQEALLGEARARKRTRRPSTTSEPGPPGLPQERQPRARHSFPSRGRTLETRPVDIDIEKGRALGGRIAPGAPKSETPFKAEMDAISVNLAAARRIPTVYSSAADYGLTDEGFPLRDGQLGRLAWRRRFPSLTTFGASCAKRKPSSAKASSSAPNLQDRVRLEVRQAYENLPATGRKREWPLRECPIPAGPRAL